MKATLLIRNEFQRLGVQVPTTPSEASSTLQQLSWESLRKQIIAHKEQRYPHDYFDSYTNQRKYFDWLASSLNFKTWEDWYKVKSIPTKLASSCVHNNYQGWLLYALISIYPEHPWQLWKFARLPAQLWKTPQFQRQAFDQLAKELNIKNPEDWYKVDKKDITTGVHKKIMMRGYHGSLARTLRRIYPDYSWQGWKFKAERSQPEAIERQRMFFDRLGKQLQIKELEDWYKVGNPQLRKIGAHRWLDLNYRGSLLKGLMQAYPEFEWQPWRFAHVPRKFWRDEHNVRSYARWIAEKLGITSQDDWYCVSKEAIMLIRSTPELKRGGSLIDWLQKYFPEYQWNEDENFIKWKHQEFLLKRLKDIFPNQTITHNIS